MTGGGPALIGMPKIEILDNFSVKCNTAELRG